MKDERFRRKDKTDGHRLSFTRTRSLSRKATSEKSRASVSVTWGKQQIKYLKSGVSMVKSNTY